MTRAAIYARVSSQAQREAHTIESQLLVLRAFVAGQGWELVGTFVDDGRSAKRGKLLARTGFAALLCDAERKLFDVIVVVDIDRLTRTDDMVERASILGPFQRLGIDIVTPAGGRLDLRSMLGELYVTMQAQFAAEENRKRAERVKAGKARAIAEGRKPAGPTPYGLIYTRVTGTWSIDELAAVIVREIFLRVAGGESCVDIADDLARRRAPGPRTGWSRAAVYRIVRKRTLVGEWSADKARGAMIRVPAIISEEEWLAAQHALLRHRRRGLARTKHFYLLEALARCACGGRIDIRSSCGARSKPNPAAYVCRERKLGRCSAKIVRCDVTDARVWAAVADELSRPEEQILAEIDQAQREHDASARDWKADLAGYRTQLTRLDSVEVAIMTRFRRGSISERAFDTELVAIGRERTFLRQQVAAADRALTSDASARSSLNAMASRLPQLRADLLAASPEDARALLREMAHDGGITIVDGLAHLDLMRFPLAAAETLGVGVVAPHVSTGYSTHHEATAATPLRIRRVA